MNEQLISGYTAFTTADEFGAARVAQAPGTSTPAVFISVEITGSIVTSVWKHC